MAVLFRFLLVGILSCFLLTFDQSKGEHVKENIFKSSGDSQKNRFENLKEGSSDESDTLKRIVVDEDDSEEILDSKIEKKLGSSSTEIFMIVFDLKVALNFNEISKTKEILKSAIKNYLKDLFSKHFKSSSNLTLQAVNFFPSYRENFTRFKLDIVCVHKVTKKADKCYNALKKIANELNIRELLLHFYDIGHSEGIIPGLKLQTR